MGLSAPLAGVGFPGMLKSFDPQRGWVPAKTIPEPRIWKLWRWLGIGDFKRPSRTRNDR